MVVTREDGMPRESAISLDHLQTVSQSKVGSLLMTLPPEKMAAVERALLFALGIRIDQ